jgi:hypothetical protein
MSSSNFIKQNLALVVGLTLPVLLIVLFFVATVLPKSLGTPPQHEMLFSINKYTYNNPPAYTVTFKAVDGKLMATMVPNVKTNNTYPANNSQTLMGYDAKTDTLREIAFDMPATAGTDTIEKEVSALHDYKIDSSAKSPDGYEASYSGYGGGGFVMDVFGGSRNNGYRISKGAVSYKVPSKNNQLYYYNDAQFIGWVIGKE